MCNIVLHYIIHSYIYSKIPCWEIEQAFGRYIGGLIPYQEFQFPQDTFHRKNQPRFFVPILWKTFYNRMLWQWLAVPVLSLGNGSNGALTPISRQFVRQQCMFGIFISLFSFSVFLIFWFMFASKQCQMSTCLLVKVLNILLNLGSYWGCGNDVRHKIIFLVEHSANLGKGSISRCIRSGNENERKHFRIKCLRKSTSIWGNRPNCESRTNIRIKGWGRINLHS